MSIIVQIVYSPPLMNTRLQKQLLPNNPHNQHFDGGEITLDTQQFFFTLPNTMDDDSYVHLVQWNTCLLNLQDLDQEELADHKRRRKNWARARKMQRIR